MTTKETVIVTGSQGFIGSYLCAELLSKGYRVVGYDNYSKYGKVRRPHDEHPNFELMTPLADLSREKPDFLQWNPKYIIAGAAMIGGISYFHKYAYDLLATNERILANTFDAALDVRAYIGDYLDRIVVISSSMVFEGADVWKDLIDTNFKDCRTLNGHQVVAAPWPTQEECVKTLPPPHSTYGLQKLASEYFARGAYEQYNLPYTIVRPFNCVGVGEDNAIGDEEVFSGNVKLQMSHVLPDIVNKCMKGQNPLHILGDGSQVRCYTNGRDIARGIVMAMESSEGKCQDFNISTSRATTVLELAEMVWKKINPDKPFRYVSDEPFTYDVKKRIPDVSKAERAFGFKAEISLEDSIDEVIEYVSKR